MTVAIGANLKNSVHDVGQAFPDDWMRELRRIVPESRAHSFLIPFWYRAGARWVLYDGMPEELIDPDHLLAPGFSGADFFERVHGLAPRDRPDWDYCPYISDVQHEMYRLHRVYAKPFWVLQGDHGGHQVAFDPWQQNLLASSGLPTKPPAVGDLPACPFDTRAILQLQRCNRLLEVGGNLDALRATGTAEGGNARLAEIQKEMRVAELAYLETQLQEMVDVARSVASRADSRDHLLYLPDGSAAQAPDAVAEYIETGRFTL